jgi:hypothetical protein
MTSRVELQRQSSIATSQSSASPLYCFSYRSTICGVKLQGHVEQPLGDSSRVHLLTMAAKMRCITMHRKAE